MTYDIGAAIAAALGLSARALYKAGGYEATIKLHSEALVRIETKLDQLLLQKAAKDV